jgi:hypothetical protein
MVHISKVAAAVTTVLFAGNVIAHPGEVHSVQQVKRELDMHNNLASHSKRALGGCENSASAKALKARAIARREATAKALRQKRGLAADSTFCKLSRYRSMLISCRAIQA